MVVPDRKTCPLQSVNETVPIGITRFSTRDHRSRLVSARKAATIGRAPTEPPPMQAGKKRPIRDRQTGLSI